MSPSRQRGLILGLIFIGVVIAVFFGLRASFAFREFRSHGGPPPFAEAFDKEPEGTNAELIRDWMTIPYISRTYRVNPRTLFDALGILPRGNEEKSLAQLNEEFFSDTPGIVIEVVKAAVRANQPVPTVTIPQPAPSPPAAP